MESRAYTIQPGWLVSLKTRVVGGVQYETSDEQSERDGQTVDRYWKTHKHVQDSGEFERACAVRGRVSSLIRGCCIHTPFGLICAERDGFTLASRVQEVRALVDEHNAAATYSRVAFGLIRGRIASDDAEAVRAILGDVADQVAAMKAGIADCNVEAIRAAASRARALGRMLDDGQAVKVSAAVDTARKAARLLVKSLGDGGDRLADFKLKQLSLEPIDSCRFAFLDDAAPVVVDGPEAPDVNVQRFGELGISGDLLKESDGMGDEILADAASALVAP